MALVRAPANHLLGEVLRSLRLGQLPESANVDVVERARKVGAGDTALACIPNGIRGYGPVKERSIFRTPAKQKKLLADRSTTGRDGIRGLKSRSCPKERSRAPGRVFPDTHDLFDSSRRYSPIIGLTTTRDG